jgi:hypothetical protein
MKLFDTATESLSYEIQKQVIRNEINYKDPYDRYITNQAYFKKDKVEKSLVYNLKHQYRDRMRARFPEWTRRTSGREKYLEMHYKYNF